MIRYFSLLVLLLFRIALQGNPIQPDDIKGARNVLNQERQAIGLLKSPEEKITKMLELGVWNQARQALSLLRSNNSSRLVRAQYFFYTNQFKKADLLVDSVLEGNRNNPSAINLKAELLIESWNLNGAEALLTEFIGKTPKQGYSKYLLGLTYLLKGDLKGLKGQINLLKTEFPEQSYSDLLSGRLLLVNNDPIKADSAFKMGLIKNPLNADLRFYYGYCQWRNARGNFLERMDDQWNLCLEINPLHYLAHWHLGNGHTRNTYKDYYEPSDSSIIHELSDFDKLIAQNKYKEALNMAETVRKKHPGSVLPQLYKASAYYMSPEPNRMVQLDSSESLFIKILNQKKNYGPAENGLAAVIKAKREPFLYFYDSIQNKIKETPNTSLSSMESIIPEAHYYPSSIEKMAFNEFYSASAYFPILNRGGYPYHIIPLHHTLAETFKDPYFNQSTTFDYRQWMDIRGVGSGAVGLEYVEKGAYLERNVLLHEFMHLVHTTIMPDKDLRKIRALYISAMKKGKILDYYAANNEHEYFAQIYPAYFSRKAVHPQDFKSMNTVDRLKAIDPDGYHFVDSLVKVENQFSKGNSNVFRDQWAELYIRLSENMRTNTPAGKLKAKAYLDSASNWDKDYVPLLLAKAGLALKTGELDIAETNIKLAESLNPNFSPTFEKNYELNKALEEGGLLDYNSAFELEKSYLIKAIDIEKDPVIAANWRQNLVDLYKANSLIPDQIQAVDSLIKNIVDISSYEKDRKNLAIAEKIDLSLQLGYPESLAPLEAAYSTNPQNYTLATHFASCLFDNNNSGRAISVLEKNMDLQKVSGNIHPDQALNLAYYQAQTGNINRAKEIIQVLLKNRVDSSLLMVKIFIGIGQLDKAEKLFLSLSLPHDFNPKSEYYYVKGELKNAQGNMEEAISSYQDALANNPYNFQAVKKLIPIFQKLNRTTALISLKGKLKSQAVKPGPLLGINLND